MTNHYWDRATAPHADRDRTEPPTDRDASDIPSDTCGHPNHGSSDHDCEPFRNVPSDRVRAYATPAQIKAAQDVLGCYRDLCVHGATADGVCPRARNVANRVVAADREQAALRSQKALATRLYDEAEAEIERLRESWICERGWRIGEDFRIRAERAEDATARVETLCDELENIWNADIRTTRRAVALLFRAALCGPAPTEDGAR